MRKRVIFKNVDEALRYLRNVIDLDVRNIKGNAWQIPAGDLYMNLKSDRELIEYAQEQFDYENEYINMLTKEIKENGKGKN